MPKADEWMPVEGPAPPPPSKGKNTGTIILILLAVVIIGAIIYFVTRKKPETATSETSETTVAIATSPAMPTTPDKIESSKPSEPKPPTTQAGIEVSPKVEKKTATKTPEKPTPPVKAPPKKVVKTPAKKSFPPVKVTPKKPTFREVEVIFDVDPEIKNGAPMAGMRAVFEKGEWQVEWDRSQRLANATKNAKTISIEPEKQSAMENMSGASNRVTIGGNKTYIKNDRLFVPFEYMSLKFKDRLRYDRNSNKVYMKIRNP